MIRVFELSGPENGHIVFVERNGEARPVIGRLELSWDEFVGLARPSTLRVVMENEFRRVMEK